MNKKNYDPKKIKISPEEQMLDDAIDVKSLRTPSAKRQAEIRAAAKRTIKELKTARTNIRIEAADIHALKCKAHERGLGYQTLISSILHMYVSEKLVEVSEVRKIAKLGLLKC